MAGPEHYSPPDGVPATTASPDVRIVSHIRSELSVRMAEVEGRTRVTVHGEIDLDCAEMVEHVLIDALRFSPGGLDVDLSAVRFFDCAGLNALLKVRAAGRGSGAELRLTAMSPAVARVMDLTGSRAAFPVVAVRDPAPPSPSDAPTAPEARPA